MASIINTNIAAIRTHNVYNRNDASMNAALTRVATGMKINSAKDGASTWAISEKMRERIRANDQANQNIQNDTALLKTAEGGISNTIDILKTLKERALDAANDTNINTNRGIIQTEINALLTQIDDNANKVSYNGRTLLNGSAGDDSTSAGVATYTGSTDSTGSTTYTFSAQKTLTAGSAISDTDVTALIDAANVTQNSATAGSPTNGDEVDLSNIADLSATNTGEGSSVTGTAKYYSADSAWKLEGTTDVNVYVRSAASSGASGASGASGSGSTTPVYTVTSTDSWYDNGGGNSVTSSTTLSGVTLRNVKVGGSSGSFLFVDGSNNQINASDSVSISVGGTAISGLTGGSSIADLKNALEAKGVTFNILDAAGDLTAADGSTKVKATDGTTDFTTSGAGVFFVAPEGTTITGITTTAVSGTYVTPATPTTPTTTTTTTTGSNNNGSGNGTLYFHIGGESGFSEAFTLNDMTTGAKGLNLVGLDVSTVANAKEAIGKIDNALTIALTEQTKIGSMEARLGYASDNIVTMNENLQAADSTMRDADLAKEMTSYMKYSVLAQASQYMLAQAGQNAFSILNLLQQ